MTISALSRVIQEDLGVDTANNPALIACLEELGRSTCDLVGIVVCNEMAEAFIADYPGPIEEEIRRLKQRFNAIREFTDARHYLCHHGKVTRREQWFFFGMFMLALIEQGKRVSRH